MKTQSTPIYNPLIRILSVAILLASIAVALPLAPARADDAGWALQFDGTTDWVELAATADVIGSGWETTKSVNLWVKPNSGNTCTDPDAASCNTIFGDKPRFWGISIGLIPSGHHGGQDCIWVWNQDASGEDLICLSYIPGEWVNIALVHAGGVLHAFKNGIERGSLPSDATLQAPGPGSVLYLGGVINAADKKSMFAGEIDEVRIWNRALTATEISDNLFNSLTVPQTGLKAYYQMSDGLGTTLTDDSENTWNGTLLDGGLGVTGEGGPPHWVTSDAFVVPEIPTAPTNLAAAAASAFQIDLSWTDNSSNESDFEIQRCSGAGCSDFGLLTFVPADTGAYSDTSAKPGTQYCYQVSAINAGGSSAFTNVACATTWSVLLLPDVMQNFRP